MKIKHQGRLIRARTKKKGAKTDVAANHNRSPKSEEKKTKKKKGQVLKGKKMKKKIEDGNHGGNLFKETGIWFHNAAPKKNRGKEEQATRKLRRRNGIKA